MQMAVVNGAVYTPGRIIPRGVVLVEDGRIAAVGEAGRLPLPEGFARWMRTGISSAPAMWTFTCTAGRRRFRRRHGGGGAHRRPAVAARRDHLVLCDYRQRASGRPLARVRRPWRRARAAGEGGSAHPGRAHGGALPEPGASGRARSFPFAYARHCRARAAALLRASPGAGDVGARAGGRPGPRAGPGRARRAGLGWALQRPLRPGVRGDACRHAAHHPPVEQHVHRAPHRAQAPPPVCWRRRWWRRA
jgi:hypothetical protein